MGQILFVKDERIKNDIKELKKNVWVLKYSNNINVRYTKLAYKLLGFNLTCKLLNAYIRHAHYKDM